ncbi:hypothetical protein Xind_01660 [Xenorhabdus indica]|nr:hypothetical protein [Xenorhabdus indica]
MKLGDSREVGSDGLVKAIKKIIFVDVVLIYCY